MESSLLPWYAVRVRSNFEQTTAGILENKGYERFLPTYPARRRWSDRVKTIDTPLFPGYVFCRLDVQQRLPVLTTPGVVSIVGVAKTPLSIPEREIAAVRSLIESGLLTHPWPYLQAGETVVIERGPLAGLTGTVVAGKGQYRIVVSITLLQRSVAAEIDLDWVTPAGRRHPALPAACMAGLGSPAIHPVNFRTQ